MLKLGENYTVNEIREICEGDGCVLVDTRDELRLSERVSEYIFSYIQIFEKNNTKIIVLLEKIFNKDDETVINFKKTKMTLKDVRQVGLNNEIVKIDNSIDVNITLDEGAQAPTFGSKDAAGADLKTIEEAYIKPGETVMLNTGIKMAIPTGYVGLIYNRSGLSCKRGLSLANNVGVIDADYRGYVKICLYNKSQEMQHVCVGERLAQIMIVPYPKVTFTAVDSLDETARGEGGFGSTGIK